MNGQVSPARRDGTWSVGMLRERGKMEDSKDKEAETEKCKLLTHVYFHNVLRGALCALSPAFPEGSRTRKSRGCGQSSLT